MAKTTKNTNIVVLKTNYGDIRIELDFANAPKTAAQFLELAQSGYYDGTLFHRVIDRFMIQGGGFTADMHPKPSQTPLHNEADNGLKNDIGTLAMARTSDPHSASTQFFINVQNNDFLNHTSKTPQGWGYAVFGKVIDGMDVVNKIKTVAITSRDGHQDVPVEDVVVNKAICVEETEPDS